MRVLFVSRWFPFPSDNGSRIRIYNLIKQLSRRHEITLLSFTQDVVSEERVKAMLKHCRAVHTVPWHPYCPTRLRAMLGYFSPVPRSMVDTYSPEMRELVRQTAAEGVFDVGIASQISSAPYVAPLEKMPRLFEEVELTALWAQYLTQEDAWRRFRYGLTWWKTTHYVRRLLRQFDGCTVASEQERANVLAVAPDYQRVVIVPNGVDVDFYSGNLGTPEPDTLIFSGALTYSANFDAMRFFLEKVFPLIKSQRPNVSLYITGQTKGVALDRLPLSNGVTFTGYLDDVRPTIARSWACVVPLRVGGGTRLKALEAMALGTPVVATSKGAEGLEVASGKDILIADDPTAFAEQTVRLLADPGLRAYLADNARRLVARRYGWEAIGARLETLLEEVVAGGGR